jgi:hypothetical protein
VLAATVPSEKPFTAARTLFVEDRLNATPMSESKATRIDKGTDIVDKN